MRIPWLRRNFLARRRLDRLFLDVPDAVLRAFQGGGDWPPYSLRSSVGGASGFEAVGRWFVEDLKELGLVPRGGRTLEIGCGCGRIARPLATDATLRELGLSYTGMDVDRASIDWCQRQISRLNPRFRFYHADCHNDSYNPRGSMAASSYRFPHRDASFDLILLTSVFTHVLPDELTHYLSEIARLLALDGVAYASFFLYGSQSATDQAGRHPLKFTFAREGYSLSREDFPANAVAFEEAFLNQTLRHAGLKLIGSPRYGGQDLVLIARDEDAGSPQLLNGWHELERERWRWTERTFTVRLPRLPAPAATLRFRFTIADAVHQQVGILRLAAAVNGVLLPAGEFTTPGEHVYVQNVPTSAVRTGDSALVRFELDRAFKTSGSDQRELGVQVAFWANCNDARRPLSPIEIA